MESAAINDVLWIPRVLAFIAVTLALALLVKLLIQIDVPDNIPAFPEQPYPLLGHLPYLWTGQRKRMKEWRKRTGDVYSLLYGSKLIIVLNGYKVIREALVKNAHAFSDRPTMPYIQDSDKGLTFANGHHWIEQRTVAINIFRTFGFGKSAMHDRANREIGKFLETVCKFGGKATDVRMLTIMSVANVVCSIIVGKRFEHNDPLFISFARSLNTTNIQSKKRFPAAIWQWLNLTPGNFTHYKSFDLQMKSNQDAFCENLIELATNKDNGMDPESFISFYLKEKEDLEKKCIPTTLNRNNLKCVILQLFVAGTETTSAILSWFMLYMLHYQDVQKKIYTDILSVVGTKRVPRLSDKDSLSYTVAALKEVMRLASILPQSLPHTCSADTEIQGYRIPAGATILCNLDSILHDEGTWQNPMVFKPERFLDEKGNLIKRHQLVPFSMGRRFCLGEPLANMKIFLYATALIQRFKLMPAEQGTFPPLAAQEGAVCSPENYEIRFVERSCVP